MSDHIHAIINTRKRQMARTEEITCSVINTLSNLRKRLGHTGKLDDILDYFAPHCRTLVDVFITFLNSLVHLGAIVCILVGARRLTFNHSVQLYRRYR